jgi:DNA primase small subunit
MKTEEFLQEKFRRYYSETEMRLPPRFTRREYGFMFFGNSMMLRHTAFTSAHAFKKFIVDRTPAHIFYSAAYYNRPDEKRMEDKMWRGADLIFDLDADHLSLPQQCTYEMMLGMVKEETKKLVEDFLVRDFGFEDMEIVFSGSRGYHIHIYDGKVLSLDSRGRREIMDYITGNGMNTEILLGKDSYVIPSVNEPGWYGRIGRAVRDYAASLLAIDRDSAIKELKEIKGIGNVKAEKVYAGLKKMQSNPKAINALPKEFTDYVIKKISIESSRGEADEPVTSDIRRLIRLPTSLHGKTGLVVKPLTLEEFDSFDPLQDAIAFGDSEVEVQVLKPFSMRIKDFSAEASEGRIVMPEYAAVFACARGFCGSL